MCMHAAASMLLECTLQKHKQHNQTQNTPKEHTHTKQTTKQQNKNKKHKQTKQQQTQKTCPEISAAKQDNKKPAPENQRQPPYWAKSGRVSCWVSSLFWSVLSTAVCHVFCLAQEERAHANEDRKSLFHDWLDRGLLTLQGLKGVIKVRPHRCITVGSPWQRVQEEAAIRVQMRRYRQHQESIQPTKEQDTQLPENNKKWNDVGTETDLEQWGDPLISDSLVPIMNFQKK